MEQLLDTQAAARVLSLRPSTLEAWRSQNRGPRYRKLGTAVRYHPVDLEEWLNEQAQGGRDTADAEREKVRIEGRLYELRSVTELDAAQLQQIGTWGRELDALLRADGLDESARRRLAEVPRLICGAVLVVEEGDDLLSRLRDGQRLAIAQAFTRHVLGVLEEVGALSFMEGALGLVLEGGFFQAYLLGENLAEALEQFRSLEGGGGEGPADG